MKCVFYATISGLFLLTISPVWGSEKRIMVKPQDCRLLTPHIAEKGVAYKAGEDVRGKKVMPADIAPPARFDTGDKYSFFLVRDVAKNTDLKQEIILGYVDVKDGQVSLNGKPLSADKHEALQAFCDERVKDN